MPGHHQENPEGFKQRDPIGHDEAVIANIQLILGHPVDALAHKKRERRTTAVERKLT